MVWALPNGWAKPLHLECRIPRRPTFRARKRVDSLTGAKQTELRDKVLKHRKPDEGGGKKKKGRQAKLEKGASPTTAGMKGR